MLQEQLDQSGLTLAAPMDQKSPTTAAHTTITHSPWPPAPVLRLGTSASCTYRLYPVLLPSVQEEKSCSHGLKDTMRKAKCMILVATSKKK